MTYTFDELLFVWVILVAVIALSVATKGIFLIALIGLLGPPILLYLYLNRKQE